MCLGGQRQTGRNLVSSYFGDDLQSFDVALCQRIHITIGYGTLRTKSSFGQLSHRFDQSGKIVGGVIHRIRGSMTGHKFVRQGDAKLLELFEVSITRVEP